MPFRPLDPSGLTHPIWELPLMAAETLGDLDRQRLRRWFQTNAVAGHGPIHLLFHPDAYGWLPSVELFRMWDELPELAAGHRHRPANYSELLAFWEARSHAQPRWRRNGAELIVTLDPLEVPADLAVTIPARWRNERLQEWETDWSQSQSRRAWSYGEEFRLIRWPSAGGELRATYR